MVFKALLQPANFTLGPDVTLNTEIHKTSVRIKAPNLVNASKRKHKSQINHYITKTCLYNFDPLEPHFYIVKLGFTGVYINFLISAQNIDCGYLLEPPRRGGSNEYHNLFFEQKYEKYQSFLPGNFWR